MGENGAGSVFRRPHQPCCHGAHRPWRHAPQAPMPTPASTALQLTPPSSTSSTILHHITIEIPSCPSCYSIGSWVRAPLDRFLRRLASSLVSLCLVSPVDNPLGPGQSKGGNCNVQVSDRSASSCEASRLVVVLHGGQVDRLILSALFASPAIKDDAHTSFSHGSVERPVPRSSVSGRP